MCKTVQFGAFAIGQGEDRQLHPCTGQLKGNIPMARGRANTNRSSAVTDHRTENTRVKQVREKNSQEIKGKGRRMANKKQRP